MDAKQLEKAARRRELTAGAQIECDLLDGRLARQQSLPGAAGKAASANAEASLYQSRRRYRELGC